MEIKRKHIIIILSILLIGIVAYLVISGKDDAEEKAEKLSKVDEAIKKGVTENPNSADAGLFNVVADPNYSDQAILDVNAMLEAQGGYWTTDDDPIVFAVLSGKTKEQLKSIDKAMLNINGVTLDVFLQDFFGEMTDYGKYDRAIAIINSAV